MDFIVIISDGALVQAIIKKNLGGRGPVIVTSPQIHHWHIVGLNNTFILAKAWNSIVNYMYIHYLYINDDY